MGKMVEREGIPRSFANITQNVKETKKDDLGSGKIMLNLMKL